MAVKPDGRDPAGRRRQPRWRWRDGKLCCDYSPVVITMIVRGWYSTGLLCAVSPAARTWRPLLPVSLGRPGELRAGDTVTVTDGVIAMDFGGPHG